ncbi:MAG TPA: hypothetical protein VI541_01850, partial [Actinomycetota bacterium]|nr:hypothetical protein [Actinomycetota bacterium]
KLIAFFVLGSLLPTAGLIYLALNGNELGALNATGRIDLATIASLGIMQTFALIATLAVSMNNVGPGFASGEAAMILARPLGRARYAMGRFIASSSITVGLCALLAVETSLPGLLTGQHRFALLWEHWGTVAFNLVVVGAITTMLSALVNPAALAAIAAYIFQAGAGAVASIRGLVTGGLLKGFLADILNLAWYVTPKFLTSPLSNQQIAGIITLPRNTLGLTVWAIAYAAGALAVTAWVVQRKRVS